MSQKRSLSPSSGSNSSALEPKKARPDPPVSLHAWLHPSAPEPLVAPSPALHSSSSTFLAFSISFERPVSSDLVLAKEARRVVRELDVVRLVGEQLVSSNEGAFQGGEGRAQGPKGKERAREPDHRMWAVRTLGLREGRDGTKGEDDYQLFESSHDDGEKFGGERVLKVLRENNGIDVLTVCCRWYGGDMIGPIRFHHIGITAQTSLLSLNKLVRLRDLRAALGALDDEVASFRAALADLGNSSADLAAGKGGGGEGQSRSPSQAQAQSQPSTGTDKDGTDKYAAIDDVGKLERLVKAKERTRDSLQAKLG